MSDKYSLKRDDFSSSLASSISECRKSKDFTDVTLVTNDEQFFSAHKLILATSSDFFKNIFQTLAQNNSYFYLSNLNSSEMQQVLDFIYLGEVQIPESFIQDFLALSNILKIKGLDSGEESYDFTNPQESNLLKSDLAKTENAEPGKSDSDEQNIMKRENREVSFTSESFDQNLIPGSKEFNEKIKSFVRNNGQAWECTLCGKTSRYLGNIKMHVEVHIEGIVFDCKLCPEKFKTRHSQSKHNAIHRRQF